MSNIIEYIYIIPIICLLEISVWIISKKCIVKYKVDMTVGKNWFICATLMIVICVLVYFFFGGGIDTKCWVDTTQYYKNALLISNNEIVLKDWISNQEWPPHIGYEVYLGFLFKIIGNNVFGACMINAYGAVFSAYLLFRIGLHLTTPNWSLKIASIYVLFPLLIHFSFYLLKDIFVLLLVELIVFSFFELLNKVCIKYIFILAGSLTLLMFFRSFYVLFLILWIAIAIFNKEKQSVLKRLLFSVLAIAVFAILITVLGMLNFNIGYTLGGKDSFLDFLPEMRVSLNWVSLSQFLGLVFSHRSQFILCSIKEILRIFVGPFFWLHPGNFVYFQSTGRFILFENLTSIYLICMLVWRIASFRRISKGYEAKCLRYLVLIFVISLLFVGDVRWRLSLMPYYVVLLMQRDSKRN